MGQHRREEREWERDETALQLSLEGIRGVLNLTEMAPLAPSHMDERVGWRKGLLWERRKALFSLRDRVALEWPPTLIAACAAPANVVSKSCWPRNNPRERFFLMDRS
jgi:hypothetical protein